MITVTLLRDFNGQIRAFQCAGHAHYAAAGSDIVCAGVSALLQSALLGLGEHMPGKVVYRMRAGDLCCVVPKAGAKARRQSDAILETMRLGLMSIRMGHRKHLRMIEKEVDEYVFHELAAFCPQKGRRQLAQRP